MLKYLILAIVLCGCGPNRLHECKPGKIGYNRFTSQQAACKQQCYTDGTCEEYWIKLYPQSPDDVE